MPKKRAARRTRSSSPGVVLVERRRADGPTRVRARWQDPDTGKSTWLTLNDGRRMKLMTKKAREQWARDKSDSLAARRAELAAGASKVTSTGLEAAVESFISTKAAETREHTIANIRGSLDFFLSWAKGRKITDTKEITVPILSNFRDVVNARKKQAPRPGGARGEWVATDEAIAPLTKNKILTHVGGCLREFRRRKLICLSSDDIGDALRKVKVSRAVPDFLAVKDLRQLLDAALRHDATTFTETREEHAGELLPGSTARFEPAAPFVLCVLLTGMRKGEAETLPWREVDLDGGSITLDPKRVKTSQGRRVDLAVSPVLAPLLRELRPRTPGPLVFPAYAGGTLASSTRKRLVDVFGAPAAFGWQALRRTASTYGTNWAPLGPWGSAKRCGHSVIVAEKSYAGLISIDPAARTLEAAMGIEDLAEEIVKSSGGVTLIAADRALEEAQ